MFTLGSRMPDGLNLGGAPVTDSVVASMSAPVLSTYFRLGHLSGAHKREKGKVSSEVRMSSSLNRHKE